MRIDNADIGMSNAAQVAELGCAAIEGGDAEIELAAVQRCDSALVAVLLEWQRAATARGLTLKVTGAPAGVLSLATVYGVEPMLPAIAPDC
jgi:phospholipid transport system transporter-binding protein